LLSERDIMDDSAKKNDQSPGLTDIMPHEKILAAMDELDGWRYVADSSYLFKRFAFNNYAQTMAFVNLVAWLARRDKHHPDCCFGYNYCEVCLTTHDAGGVTVNDVAFAQALDRLMG